MHEEHGRLLLDRKLQGKGTRGGITAGKLGGTGCAAAVRAHALPIYQLLTSYE
jgi:hypothetical protein